MYLWDVFIGCASLPFKHDFKGKLFCRMERDHSEAERAQHIQQIHDLQEHIQEKERQLMELQEQVCVLELCVVHQFEISLS